MEQDYLGNLLKNEQYWDKETVKLTEINYDVVKETATAVNLYTEWSKRPCWTYLVTLQCNMLLTQI